MVTVVTGVAIAEPVAADRISPDPDFLLYPNPTTGTFTLKRSRETLQEQVWVDILDMRGKKVVSAQAFEGESHLFVLSGLSPGLYFVRAKQGDKSETLKLVLTR